ncbi:MAG: helix-hairpin-helix domain-containing protein [Phycisphaerales bacterium]|nr:helix-hairpin-helix domain-containing protein [Phycisphaerales bacterium]
MSARNKSERSVAPKSNQSDWSRTPAAIFATVVLAIASLAGLGWSWNRTIERSQGYESEPVSAAIEDGSSSRDPWVIEDHTADYTARSIDQGSLSVVRRIDINSADVAMLDLLPGIGPALASRILKDREENGVYRTIDELKRVRGIGPKTVEKLRSLVIVNDSPANPMSDDDSHSASGD